MCQAGSEGRDQGSGVRCKVAGIRKMKRVKGKGAGIKFRGIWSR